MKRMVALFLVLLLSIESLAAVVSDNDGSAFITKAEFDSLKNNFQSQIDQYNNSIDSKIDGAIANYLAGINLSKKQLKNIYYKNWEYVTCVKGALGNKWGALNCDYTHSMLALPRQSSTGAWYQSWWTYCTLNYTRPSSTYQNRLLCDAGVEGSTLPNTVVWQGRSRNLVETVQLQLVESNTSNAGYYSGYMNEAASGSMYWCDMVKLSPGYYSDFLTRPDNFWVPKFWYTSGTNYGRRVVSTTYARSGIMRIELVSVDGKKTDFDHILSFDNCYFPYMTDIDWTKTLRTLDNTINDIWTLKSYKNAAAKSGKWACVSTNNSEGRIKSVTNMAGYYSGVCGSEDTTKMVSGGVIANNYRADRIYQTSEEDVFKWEEGNVTKGLSQLSLIEGLPLLYAKYDDEIEWEPIFNNIWKNGVVDNDTEVNLKFAIVPFSAEGVAPQDKIIKCIGSTTDYITTNNRKVKAKFKMPEDGIVYCIWQPSDSSYQSATSWEVNLDLKQCNTYIHTDAS